MFSSDEVLHEGVDVAYGCRHSKEIKPDEVLLNIISTIIGRVIITFAGEAKSKFCKEILKQ